MRRLLDWWRSDRPVFSEDGVERWFLACTGCHRIRPYYDLVAAKGEGVLACPSCGDRHVRPTIVGNWFTGCWHVLMRGYLWRHIVRRRAHQSEWDPRMPYLPVEFPGFR